MALSSRRLHVASIAIALMIAPATAQQERPPGLGAPGSPYPFGPGGDEAGGRGDGQADIFRQFGHDFGTVTPGGGARAGRMQGGNGNGGMVVGPGGVIVPGAPRPPQRAERKAPPKPTLEQKQAEIRRTLVPRAPLAQARRKTLDDLYAKLAAASDGREAKSIASLISAIWQRSSSDTANLLMSRADAAMGAQNYPAALHVLDKLVELQPDWAEAWNRRATVRFLAGDTDGSMSDVEHVLKLEPKHFAALSGLAMMLQRAGLDKRALQVYRRAAAIYPHQSGVDEIIEKLSLEVEGQGI